MTDLRTSTSIALAMASALAWPVAAAAQTTEAARPDDASAEPDVETQEPEQGEQTSDRDIVITGSRISTAGFDAPTPTTVIGTAELRQAGRTDIQATLADLPQVRLTQSATSTNAISQSGFAPADLRGLGASRTLVLVNGRRYVTGGDLQTVPYSLVKQIDIVTGGASAAWGSDAVAGVINIILDDKFQGVTLGAQAGVSSRGDASKYLFNAAYGTNITDRWHMMIGADYLDDDGIFPGDKRPRIGSTAFFPGTDGKLYPTQGIRQSDRAFGGLIIGGPLAGLTFNDDGSLRPFRFGRRSGSLMAGGEGWNFDQTRSIAAPIERLNVFTRSSYEVSDPLRFWVEANYNRVADERPFFPDLTPSQTPYTYSIDNPFLSPAVRQQFVAAGVTSFNMTRVVSDIALIPFIYDRETKQGAVGLDGKFGGGKWRYDAFFSHGEQVQDMNFPGLIKKAEFLNAIDAVRSGNQIVCRVALTDPNTACRPLNLFGQGRADPAAVDYVNADWRLMITNWLDNGGVSVSGEPFTIWDRPVSVAGGLEYRKHAFEILYDETSLRGEFSSLNGVNVPKRGYDVKEAFAEVAVPLLADLPLVQELMLNGAARVSKYSTFKDNIWSWKLGGTWQVIDDLKFRTTRSRDIRAPSLPEMFNNPGSLFSVVTDASLPSRPSVQVVLRTGGNPNLAPETADTWTIGAVLTPRMLPGLNLSVDYYDIKIDDVITTLTAQQIVNACYLQGNAAACSQLTRNSAGALTDINATFINLARYTTKGVDFELSYRTRLEDIGIPGQLSLRGLANYVDTLVVDNGVLAIEGAGYASAHAAFLTPKWRVNTALGYESTTMGADLRMRWISKSQYAPPTVLVNVGDNEIDARAYIDLSLRAYLPFGSDNDRLTVYFSVANLFDRQPPIAAVNSPYYDLIGRYFTAGATMRF